MFDSNLTDNLLIAHATEWHASGHGVALAFVIKTWGSSPRHVGSVMIIRDDLLIEGSVSGGCVEGAVIEAGSEAIKTGVGTRLDFGVENETAWELGVLCSQILLVSPIGSADQPECAGFVADLRARHSAPL